MGKVSRSKGYAGIHYDPRFRRYRARLGVNGHHYSAGSWLTEKEAVVARDRLALHLGLPDRVQLPRASLRQGPASPQQLRWLSDLSRRKTRGSSYLDVWKTEHETWGFRIRFAGNDWVQSGYVSERDAALARDRFALHVVGSAAVLNFPKKSPKPASLKELRKELIRQRLRIGRLTSKYRGVCHSAHLSSQAPWRAALKIGTRQRGLGFWKTEREAAIAVDRASLFYLDGRVRLNFPRRKKTLEPADAETLRAEARQKVKETASSRFRGVSWWRGAWYAEIQHENRREYLGRFQVEEDAALAFDKAALRLLGRRAKLNFDPETGEELLGARRRLR